jgi:hypothetical protein
LKHARRFIKDVETDRAAHQAIQSNR